MEKISIIKTSNLIDYSDFFFKSYLFCFEGCYNQSYYAVSSFSMPFFLYFKDFESARRFMTTYKGNHSASYWNKLRRHLYPLGDLDVLINLLYDARICRLSLRFGE